VDGASLTQLAESKVDLGSGSNRSVRNKAGKFHCNLYSLAFELEQKKASHCMLPRRIQASGSPFLEYRPLLFEEFSDLRVGSR